MQISQCGISFIGGDVPGFYNNPIKAEPEKDEPDKEPVVKKKEKQWDTDLILSWYRLGVFMPFFRAHSHIDNLRREPWCFGEETCKLIQKSVLLRYKLLVYLYT